MIAICLPSGVTNILLLLWVEGLWVEGLVRRRSRFVCEGSRGVMGVIRVTILKL